MFTITEIVKDGILEIQFSSNRADNKMYQIICAKGNVLQKGKYTFKLDENELKEFTVQ